MKVFAVFALVAFFASGKAQDENEGCQVCRDSLHLLFEAGHSEENLERETQLIIEEVCPSFEDSKTCATSVEQYWSLMSRAIFNDKIAFRLCATISPDCRPGPQRKWDCNTCLEDMKLVSDLMSDDVEAQWVIDSLTNGKFCHNHNLKPEEILECEIFVRLLTPPALKTVFGYFDLHASRVCSGVYDGICE